MTASLTAAAPVATLEFQLNGSPASVAYEPGMRLLEILRERCGITSVKDGCSPEGTCGCCTVLVDGRPALACLKKPEHVAGRSVVTLEGLPPSRRDLLAKAFVDEGALQCGFCTPGIVMRAAALLESPRPPDRETIEHALQGHLCRCTGYKRIVRAIETAAARAADLPGTKASSGGGPDSFTGAVAPPHGGVGAPAPRYRGRAYALGEAPFVADMDVPGLLHGAFALSEHPRARIVSLDVTAALVMPGVVRVLTAADVPGERRVGLLVRDWPVFVAPGEWTRTTGDVLAMVVAGTRRQAREAARAVQVTYEPARPVTTVEEALAPGAPRVDPAGNILEACAYARGDVDASLAASAHVLHEVFETQRIEHAFLEPEACLVSPRALAAEDGGIAGIHVFSQGQGVHDDQVQIAAVLGVPREGVQVELVPSGGAFGGKEDLSVQAQTALAAFLLARPVKTVLSREESIRIHPKRHPMTLDYTVGCDVEGRLTAVRARLVGDSGAYASVGGKVLERAAGHACGPYRVPSVDVEARAIRTNNPTSGAMRGFGVCQSAFAMEGMLDRLAERVGLDGWEMRWRNILRPGDRFATGQVMNESCAGLAETLLRARDAYRGARHAGIACGIKNTGIGNGQQDIGRVRLRVVEGGRLEITTGYTEMGQGLFTVLRQVVAEETGLDAELMDVKTVSELSVLCGMTTASRATALASTAAAAAARALASELAHAPLAELAGRELRGELVCDFTVPPGGVGERSARGDPSGSGTAVDDPVTHLTFGYATQVVVLDEHGRLAKVVAAHDVGRVMNPSLCAGQIEGAVHMGLGYALSEELVVREGRPDTSLRNLGILHARDMPEVEVILVEVPDRLGAYGVKGVGEIGLVPTAAAVAGALHSFDGKRRARLPMADAPAAVGLIPGSRRIR